MNWSNAKAGTPGCACYACYACYASNERLAAANASGDLNAIEGVDGGALLRLKMSVPQRSAAARTRGNLNAISNLTFPREKGSG